MMSKTGIPELLALVPKFWACEQENKGTIRKEIVIGKLYMQFLWRSKKHFWGRFGGGWNWKLGFQIGGSTVIVNLLTFSLRFWWKKNEV